MTPHELEQYLHEHIPLSLAMQISVREVSLDKVVLQAPLAPNINHRETVFGGSASAVAILSGWSLLQSRLTAAGIACRLVIQRNTMDYDAPISGNFTAGASIENTETWEPFVRMLKRKGKARITVSSVLEFEGRAVGHFHGEFVALGTAGA